MDILPKDIALEIFGETAVGFNNAIYDEQMLDTLKERYKNVPKRSATQMETPKEDALTRNLQR